MSVRIVFLPVKPNFFLFQQLLVRYIINDSAIYTAILQMTYIHVLHSVPKKTDSKQTTKVLYIVDVAGYFGVPKTNIQIVNIHLYS